MTDKAQFAKGIGRWIGTAEVYGGDGRFLGNATDRRHVQSEEQGGRIRIDLSFVGPFKFAGHYYIQPMAGYRLYQGPANTGFAETLAENLIDANAYWPVTGLSQRFFLMILPGDDRQVSLGLMSRGERLLYVVVGEYHRVESAEDAPIPELVNGTHFDLTNDPSAGRGEILLQRRGAWRGTLNLLDAQLEPQGSSDYHERIEPLGDHLDLWIEGTGFDPERRQVHLHTDGWQAWSAPGAVTGSYSLSGGRALSGHFHHHGRELRVWRREVASHDGSSKAVLHTWYRGGQRIGAAYGVLGFSDE